MKLILIVSLILSLYSETPNLLTMDLLFNKGNIYRIKGVDTKINFYLNSKTNVSLIPPSYMNLIKRTFQNKKIFNFCKRQHFYIYEKSYENFFCEKNDKSTNREAEGTKLNFNFDNYTISIKESKLFQQKGKYFYFNFWTNNTITDIILSDILLKEIPNLNKDNIQYIRQLEEEEKKENEQNGNDNGKKENSDNNTFRNESSNNKQNQVNANKSGIGWLGVCLIILLSIIVIYVLFVAFRFYRRKKYQNPSFYYKITEEMFDDITPIE